eukprot:TRINITY_DN16184_c1_g1_i1.p1 TRINITY_DN16184_c1_g1~~TRINITY_DN16184_c1_g1_i1.p1  ORF type:complete len:415 (+),score=86.88 TRINITY_DN16184_c1_g1_i1:176-1420(+)
MSRFHTCDLFDPSSSSSFFQTQTSLLKPYPSLFTQELTFALDLLNPNPNPFQISPHCLFPLNPPSPLDLFESATDLIQIHKTPFSASYRGLHHRSGSDLYLRSLCDRVSALELGFDRVLNGTTIDGGDRKYKWTTEIKGLEKKSGVDQKYKLVAEIKGGKKDLYGREVEKAEKNYKWTAEIKGKGKDAPISRTYTFQASTAPSGKVSKKDLKEKKCLKPGPRVVEIEDTDHAAIALRQAFARSRAAAAGGSKGKKKELSPQDAALIIQMSFRAHLVRRSQMLRGLRELAIAKAKLKELRVFFSNFSYRRRIAADAEERQRFSEKIIVLLLTVDAIQGSDCTVRAARRSMVVELESMLDVVDPQPPGKLGSMKRRKFDLPENGLIHKELAMGVSEVVQMLDQEDNGSDAFAEVSI